MPKRQAGLGKLWMSAALAALAVSPAAAQEPAATTQAAQAETSAAQQLGRQMYRYDQAAWNATDEISKSVDLSSPGELRGYLVEPLDNGNLSTVFYGENGGKYFEFARYEVAGSKVVGGGVLEADRRTALSPMLLSMAAAKSAAIDELMRREWGFCSNSAANTLILPPDRDGRIAVYFLTSTTQNGVYPFGGHYRIDIAQDGSVADARQYTKSCLNMRLEAGPDGAEPVGLGVSHLLDEEPTEIHYFQSHYMPVQLFVLIDGNAWVIESGALIEKVEDFGE